jgi:MoaA/NifB/PqqE/SkfB family radical SAM enzyme
MKKLIKLESTKKYLFVYWQLNDFCNYKCNYCTPLLNQGYFSIRNKQHVPDEDRILKFLENIGDKKTAGDVYFTLSGGEPTIHPMFSEILKKLHSIETIKKIEVITNGSRPMNWWRSQEFLPDLLRISLHPEYTEIDHINELANYALDKNVLVRFNLSMDPLNWDKSVQLYEQLNDDLKQFVKPKTLHDWTKRQRQIKKYSEEQLNWIKKIFSETVDGTEIDNLFNYTQATYDTGETGKLDFVHTVINDHKYFNWRCTAGSYSISINARGQVHAGLCKQQLLGNIDDFTLLDELLICRSNICQCPTDLLIPKFRQ